MHSTGDKSRELHSLSEEEIRKRLYGNSSGPAPKKNHLDIQKELKSLRRELDQTKKKLKKAQGLQTKKAALIVALSLAVVVVTALAIMLVGHDGPQGPQKDPTVADATPVPDKSQVRYTIQVGVYDNMKDLEKFSFHLRAKEYNVFIRESQYSSGSKKYIVYVGSFPDKRSASKLLKRLKIKEGIRDSFIASIPR